MDKIELQIGRMAQGEAVDATPELTEALGDLGLSFEEASGNLKLQRPLELLDSELIGQNLHSDARDALSKLEVHWSIDSTNTYLMSKTHESDFHGSACIAERQVSGRGRRGRYWVSPFGKNIYMSLGWKIPAKTGVSGLSLVVGMQVVKSLRLAGLSGVGLKWPNDVLLDNGKLSGILIEMGATSRGRVEVVIGIGVNLQLDESEASEIDQPWSSAGEARTISRNQLVSLLLSNLISELNHYSISGFERYKSSWDEFNVYSDCPVQILIGDKVIEGIDRGVDEGGNLILETSQGLRTFNAGEVSLRALR